MNFRSDEYNALRGSGQIVLHRQQAISKSSDVEFSAKDRLFPRMTLPIFSLRLLGRLSLGIFQFFICKKYCKCTWCV